MTLAVCGCFLPALLQSGSFYEVVLVQIKRTFDCNHGINKRVVLIDIMMQINTARQGLIEIAMAAAGSAARLQTPPRQEAQIPCFGSHRTAPELCGTINIYPRSLFSRSALPSPLAILSGDIIGSHVKKGLTHYKNNTRM